MVGGTGDPVGGGVEGVDRVIGFEVVFVVVVVVDDDERDEWGLGDENGLEGIVGRRGKGVLVDF